MRTTTSYTASEKQVAYVRRLLAERDLTGTVWGRPDSDGALDRLLATHRFDGIAATQWISELITLPRRPETTAYEAANPLPEPGTFWEIDGEIWAAKKARTSGHTYATRLRNGDWEYIRGGLNIIARSGVRLTAQLAANAGREASRCVFCWLPLGGRDGTERRSLAVGYGEKCARNQGLPWGADTLAPAPAAHSCEDYDGECCSPTGLAYGAALAG